MKAISLLLTLLCLGGQLEAQPKKSVVKQLKITILSTMLTAQRGVGEWGFSALVEADSIKILFDAGARPKTVLDNCKELRIDLAAVPVLVLSHNHDDHTVGWIPLRQAVKESNPAALAHTHVGRGLFDTRLLAQGEVNTRRQKDSLLYVQSNGRISVHNGFVELYPGIFLTGPVPRPNPERNYTLGGSVVRKKRCLRADRR
jgi:7,8-dihydropterin-6-yl-methyl-4-(beta-D-ribofuranosyl)aminobenzene 5'-phosphate synthase